MKTSEYISFTIDRLPIGYVFTYVEFITEVGKKEAVIKALNRMAALGKIAKLHRLSIYKRSTEELLEITSSEDKWNPKAVNQAKEELRKRNVSDKAITNAKYLAEKSDRIEMLKRAKESFSVLDFLLKPTKTVIEILFSWELKKEGYTKKATQQKWIFAGIIRAY